MNWKEESAKTMKEFVSFLEKTEETKLPAIISYRITCVKRRTALMSRLFSQGADNHYLAKKLVSTVSDLEIALTKTEEDFKKNPLFSHLSWFIDAFNSIRLFEEENISYF
ncbi:MAG TPA: hypothetical protein P5230_00205 [Candidatus Magasanikbacteria bacterium]|nr:hypothetical protein [Candidatus Magasanikbacteria bacterium]